MSEVLGILKPDERRSLSRVLTGMEAPDRALLFPFLRHFGEAIRTFIAEELVLLNRSDVLAWPDDVDHLVRSATYIIRENAPVWPLTQLEEPWQWAEESIRAEITRWVNQPLVGWENACTPSMLAAFKTGEMLRRAAF